MSSFYADMAKVATEMLTEFGTTVQFRRRGIAPVSATAARFDINIFNRGKQSVEDGDAVFYVAPTITITPQEADIIVLASQEYTVTKVNKIDPAGTIVCWELTTDLVRS